MHVTKLDTCKLSVEQRRIHEGEILETDVMALGKEGGEDLCHKDTRSK